MVFFLVSYSFLIYSLRISIFGLLRFNIPLLFIHDEHTSNFNKKYREVKPTLVSTSKIANPNQVGKLIYKTWKKPSSSFRKLGLTLSTWNRTKETVARKDEMKLGLELEEFKQATVVVIKFEGCVLILIGSPFILGALQRWREI